MNKTSPTAGLSNWRPAGRIRPATPSNPARDHPPGVSLIADRRPHSPDCAVVCGRAVDNSLYRGHS